MNEFISTFNSLAWIVGNMFIAYIALIVPIFTLVYYIIYDPRATTAGKLIFRFFISLIGVIALVFIGIFIDPAGDRAWYNVPDTIDVWRPALRLVVYGYVAITTTSLMVLLILRRWFPDRIKTAPPELKTRHDTREIPVIRSLFKSAPNGAEEETDSISR